MIVFGSDYRITPGHVEPGATAQTLLEGGPIAIAVAPAGLRASRDASIASIGVVALDGDDSATPRQPSSLAGKLGATVVTAPGAGPDRGRLAPGRARGAGSP